MRTKRYARRSVAALAASAAIAALLAAPAAAVTNGTPTGDYGEAYWHTARITIGDNFRSCSGTLVSDQWLVTAASCFAENPAQGFRINPGPPSRPTTAQFWYGAVQAKGGGGTYKLTQRIIDLKPREDRDLVFARLETRVGLGGARLPSRPPQQAETLQLAGFGRTATDWVPLKQHLADTAVSSVTGTTFTVSGASDTCRGDAGGPAYRGDQWAPELAGVHSTSWQKGCFGSSETRGGSVETRVDDLLDWFGQHNPDQFLECSRFTRFYATKAGAVKYTENNSMPNSTLIPALDGVDYWPSLGTYGFSVPGTLKAGPAVAWSVHQKTGATDPFNDGDLRLWTVPSWEFTGGERVGTGWGHYLSAANRDKLTVDEKGRIYRIDPNGDLRLFVWDTAAKRWQNDAGVVLDTGWGRFNSITAAGDGVLYGRTTAGALIRFHYDHATQAWVQREQVTPGNWSGYAQLVSPGGDVIYGTLLPSTSQKIAWTRYNPNTNTWATHRVVGTGAHWGGDHSITLKPNVCVGTR
ncbi:tachylectin-related carbohydrate-binding protein [Amycolatopsis magusensis]|uniref:tachylectin-related carbohydrate-binding protein n=1 Tax=Amycolatopsis magusensis TaxID=882444 RepID=UPI0024A83054|nr:tachylectin-related carbohydrate-binding protein [Amycolatopsis magusensis]MDI5978622.1 tachylectin-related carbohydrate-binding protein [Amycolatopsis magusensis]